MNIIKIQFFFYSQGQPYFLKFMTDKKTRFQKFFTLAQSTATI